MSNPKIEAVCNLVLLALSGADDGTIHDGGGKATAQLRELCELPNSEPITKLLRAALKDLEYNKKVTIERSSTRTQTISLVNPLSRQKIKALRTARKDNLALILPSAETNEADAADEPASVESSSPSASDMIERLAAIIEKLERKLASFEAIEEENVALRSQVETLTARVEALTTAQTSDNPRAQEILRRYPS